MKMLRALYIIRARSISAEIVLACTALVIGSFSRVGAFGVVIFVQLIMQRQIQGAFGQNCCPSLVPTGSLWEVACRRGAPIVQAPAQLVVVSCGVIMLRGLIY